MDLAFSCFDSVPVKSALTCDSILANYSGIRIEFSGRYGLSNRIRALAGYSAVAILTGRDVEFDWTAHRSCPGEFFEVFEHPWYKNSRAAELDSPYLVTAETPPLHCGATQSTILSGFAVDEKFKELYFDYVQEFYRLLSPVTAVKDRVKALGVLPTEKILGVHVRRTDMIDHCIKRGLELPSDEKMYAEVDKYIRNNNSSRVFVCSDNPESLADFTKKYGDRVVAFPNNWDLKYISDAADTTKQHRLTGLLESVADLYMLSKSDFIIGTKHSSFSDFASTWGGVELIRV